MVAAIGSNPKRWVKPLKHLFKLAMSYIPKTSYIPIDLHSHSYYSDGVLSPTKLVEMAHANGSQLLALTDHDCTDGLDEASQAAATLHLPFVKGVEISVTWQETQTIHVVGLAIDPSNAALSAGLKKLRSGRLGRLKKMHDVLAESGIHGVYEGALRYAKNPQLVGRLHIARYLVQLGLFGTTNQVFRYYLTPGKIGYVPHRWSTLEEAIAWIRQANGFAVLAHPGRYLLNSQEMTQLLSTFSQLGGAAIEAGSARHSAKEIQDYLRCAEQFNLKVSVGSDFHAPSYGGRSVGYSPALPQDNQGIWHRWLSTS